MLLWYRRVSAALDPIRSLSASLRHSPPRARQRSFLRQAHTLSVRGAEDPSARHPRELEVPLLRDQSQAGHWPRSRREGWSSGSTRQWWRQGRFTGSSGNWFQFLRFLYTFDVWFLWGIYAHDWSSFYSVKTWILDSKQALIAIKLRFTKSNTDLDPQILSYDIYHSRVNHILGIYLPLRYLVINSFWTSFCWADSIIRLLLNVFSVWNIFSFQKCH